MSHSAGLPPLFLDRSLGRYTVPDILRAAGWQLVTLAEHYGTPADEDIPDTEWLRMAGNEGWVALTKDKRIRYQTENKEALTKNGVRCFCITNQSLSGDDLAYRFLNNKERMVKACRQPGPFFYAVYSDNIVRKL